MHDKILAWQIALGKVLRSYIETCEIDLLAYGCQFVGRFSKLDSSARGNVRNGLQIRLRYMGLNTVSSQLVDDTVLGIEAFDSSAFQNGIYASSVAISRGEQPFNAGKSVAPNTPTQSCFVGYFQSKQSICDKRTVTSPSETITLLNGL